MILSIVTILLLSLKTTFSFHVGSNFLPFQSQKPNTIKPALATTTTTTATNKNNNEIVKNILSPIANTIATVFLTSALVLSSSPSIANAEGSKVIAQISGSGLVFKDTLVIESFDDPKVQGVTLYISSFQRPITEKLQKGFFSDPSFSSVSCARTGPIKVADNINLTPSGEEVFQESRSLLFKSLRVQRVYDKEKNTAVYVSYNTRIDKSEDGNKSRFKSSLCALNLE